MQLTTVAILALSSTIGLGLFALSTRHGAGLQVDSVTYVSAARVLASRPLAFYRLSRSGVIGQFDHFPPFYSLILAGTAWLGWDVIDGARVVNALLLLLTIFLLFALLSRHTSLHMAAVAPLGLVMLGGFVLTCFAWVMSDGLFLVLVLLILILLDSIFSMRDISYSRWVATVILGILVALSILTRLVGIGVFGFTVLSFVLFDQRDRWRSAALVGIPTVILTAPWFMSRISGSRIGDRPILFHPPTAVELIKMGEHLGTWLLPERLAQPTWLLTLALCTLGLALSTVTVWKQAHHSGGEGNRFTASLCLFIVCYSVTVIVAHLTVDAAIPFDRRMFAPVAMCMVVLGALGADRLSHRLFAGGRLRVALLPVVVTLLLGAALRTGRETFSAFTDGLGYASPSWRASASLAFLKQLPTTSLVYSNASDVAYLLLGRSTIPEPKDTRRLIGRAVVSWDYDLQLAEMYRRLARDHGFLLYVDASQRSTDPPLDTILALGSFSQMPLADGLVLTPR